MSIENLMLILVLIIVPNKQQVRKSVFELKFILLTLKLMISSLYYVLTRFWVKLMIKEINCEINYMPAFTKHNWLNKINLAPISRTKNF